MAFNDADKGMAKRILKHYCSSWDELRYDEIRNKPYFIGKRSKESTTEILFPINCYKAMTFDELKTCIVDSGSTSMNLAVYNSDSTLVLYKAELGLKPPIQLKENESCSVSDNCNVADSSKKRKIDLISNSPATTSVCPEHDESTSNTDSLQVDRHSAVDSNLSVVESEEEEEESEDSSSCFDDKSGIQHLLLH